MMKLNPKHFDKADGFRGHPDRWVVYHTFILTQHERDTLDPDQRIDRAQQRAAKFGGVRGRGGDGESLIAFPTRDLVGLCEKLNAEIGE